MAIPTLTWNVTPMVPFWGKGYISHPGALFTSLHTVLTDHSTFWETSVLDPTTPFGGREYIEIKPKAGSAIPNFRIFLAGMSATASYPTSFIDDPNQSGVWTNNGGAVYCSCAPDVGGTYAGITTDPWKTGSPYASRSSNRWTGFARGMGGMSYDWDPDVIWLTESDEVLCIHLMRRGDQTQQFAMFGAMFQAPTPLEGDPVRGDEGIYGMVGSGQWPGMARDFWNNEGTDQDSIYAFQSIRRGVSGTPDLRIRPPFIVAFDPAYDYGAGTYARRIHRYTGSYNAQGESSLYSKPMFEQFDGAIIGEGVGYRFNTTGKCVGELRQMRRCKGYMAHYNLADTSGIVQFASFGYRHTYDDGDNLFFDNSPNPT